VANVIEILIQAKDQATAVMANVSKEASGLNATLAQFGGTGGIALAAAAGMGTLALAGAELAKHYSETARQVLNVSNVSGVSTVNIQAMQRAVVNAGGSAEEVGLAFRRLAVGVENNKAALAAHNITARDTWGAMLQVADAMEKAKTGIERSALATAAFGRGGSGFVAVLSQGSKALLAFRDEMVHLGVVMSDSQLQKFLQLHERIDQLNASMEAMKLQLASFIVPLMLKFFEVVEAIRIRVALLVPTVSLLNDTLDALSEKFNNAFAGSKSHEAMDRVKQDAMAMAAAVVKADADIKAAKAFAALFTNVGQGDAGGTGGASSGDLGATLRWQNRGSTWGTNQGTLGQGPGQLMMQIGPMADKAKEHLMTFRELMLRVAGDIVQAFNTIGQSLSNSILGVFMNLTNRAQTFRTAMVTIFDGIRDGILQAIGEIVAAAVTRAFLKILGIVLSSVTGNPFFAVAGGALPGGGGPVGVPGANSTSGGGGNTYIIQTISAKDVLSSLIDPRGQMRSANSRLSEIAAVS
jgi:hypothetical protein